MVGKQLEPPKPLKPPRPPESWRSTLVYASLGAVALYAFGLVDHSKIGLTMAVGEFVIVVYYRLTGNWRYRRQMARWRTKHTIDESVGDIGA